MLASKSVDEALLALTWTCGLSEGSVQNERSAGVDHAVTHAGRIVTVARVPRRADASRASIGLFGDACDAADQSARVTSRASTSPHGRIYMYNDDPTVRANKGHVHSHSTLRAPKAHLVLENSDPYAPPSRSRPPRAAQLARGRAAVCSAGKAAWPWTHPTSAS